MSIDKQNCFLLQEGSDVILTLEDKAILDENNDDVLINVNIAEDERV